MYRALLDYVLYLSHEKLFDNCGMIVMRVFQPPEIALRPSIPALLSSAGIDTAKFDGKMRKSTEILLPEIIISAITNAFYFRRDC